MGCFFLTEYKNIYTENIWWLGKIFEIMDSWKLDVVSYEKVLNNPGPHFNIPIFHSFIFYDSHYSRSLSYIKILDKYFEYFQFSSVQSLSCVSLWPQELQHTRPPCPLPTSRVHTNHLHRVSDAIQPSHPLLSPSPPALNLSQHQVFSNESALRIRWPKYWSFSFSVSPSDEHPRLISFRMDWLDLLAVQGTLKSLLQHHSSKTSLTQMLC